jgi:hypothetical protein
MQIQTGLLSHARKLLFAAKSLTFAFDFLLTSGGGNPWHRCANAACIPGRLPVTRELIGARE